MDLLEAYRKVPIDELWKVVGVVEDAIDRWERRVEHEPALRLRIRQAYESLNVVNQAIAERTGVFVDDSELN